MLSDNKLQNIIKIVALIRWPITVALLCFVFWKPVSIIVNDSPNLFNNSESVSFGGFTMKVKNDLSIKQTEMLNESLFGLNSFQLYQLIDIYRPKEDTSRVNYFNENYYYEAFEELEKRGLVKIFENDYTKKESTPIDKHFAYKVTPLGFKTGKIAKELFLRFAKELTKDPLDGKSQNH